MKTKNLLLALAAAAALFAPQAAHAQLSFSLATDTLSGVPGQTLTFVGRVTNTLADVSLVGSSGSVTGPAALTDYFPFGFPSPLGAGFDSGLIPIFDLRISDAATPGIITGFYNLEFSQAGQPLSRTISYSVVTLVPEPGTLALAAGGVLPLMDLVRRRRRL
jgi:hypothetical protein